MKRCPFCAEEIQDAAIVCRFCNRALTAAPATATAGPQRPTVTPSTANNRAAARLVVKLILLIVGSVVVLAIIGAIVGGQQQAARRAQLERVRAVNLKRTVYNALLMKATPADVATRYQLSPEQVREIEAEGKRLGWTLVNASGVTPEPPPPEPTGIAITAADLFDAFDTNEVAANREYKGRQVIVSGNLDRIATDILDTPYVTFATPRLFSVQAFFTKRDEGMLADLRPGEHVRLHCRCDGKFGNVLLRACRVLR